jgi:hypothetical protein
LVKRAKHLAAERRFARPASLGGAIRLIRTTIETKLSQILTESKLRKSPDGGWHALGLA